MFYQNKNRHIQILIKTSFTFSEHLHHEIEVLICTQGTFDVSCKGVRRILYPGDIMIAFPNDLHEYRETETGEGYLLIFTPDFSKIIKNTIENYKYDNFTSMKSIIPLFQQLHAEFSADRSLTVMSGYLHLILGNITKKLSHLASGPDAKTDLLTASLKYVSTNYTSPLTLQTLSKKMGVSHNHLSRVFSEKIPGGFCTYLQSLRVNHACELLKNTNQSIYEVLYNSGFSNQRTFYRVFKAETGLTPKEYKKLNS